MKAKHIKSQLLPLPPFKEAAPQFRKSSFVFASSLTPTPTDSPSAPAVESASSTTSADGETIPEHGAIPVDDLFSSTTKHPSFATMSPFTGRTAEMNYKLSKATNPLTSLAVQSVKQLPSRKALHSAEERLAAKFRAEAISRATARATALAAQSAHAAERKPFDVAKALAKLVHVEPSSHARPRTSLMEESARRLSRKDHISRREGEMVQHAAFHGWMDKLKKKTSEETKDADHDADKAKNYGLLASQVVHSMELSQLDGEEVDK